MMYKKGSISLSINMIVVVVLAFVMLGLMLTLGRNIVDSAGSTAEQVSEQTRQDIINRLIQSNDPLYFTQRRFEVGFGRQLPIMFGIKNTMPSERNLRVVIRYINQSNGELINITAYEDVHDGISGSIGEFQWDVGLQQFSPGEGKPFDVIYIAPRAVGTNQFRFQIRDNDHNIVAEQSIFIIVQ